MTNHKYWYSNPVLLLIAGLAAAYLFFRTLNDERSLFGALVSQFNTTPPAQIGVIHGVRMSIPSGYLYFPVEYDGEESWKIEDKKKNRNRDGEIRAFSIYVQWPDMEPRTADNEASYQESFKGNREHNWLMIGFQRNSKKISPAEQVTLEGNGLGRLVAGELTNFDFDQPWRDKNVPSDVHFEIEKNQALRLTVATPVGSGTEKRAIWNNELFWDGAPNKQIGTFIECRNRKTITADHPGSCTHKFELQELNGVASITYKSGHLKQWKDIETKVRKLLLSFAAPEKSSLDITR